MIHECPVCKKHVEQAYQVHSTSLEPFTGAYGMEGLIAWGGFGVERTILCQTDRFVHFKFDRLENAEHLVEMKPYDEDKLETIRQYHEEHPQPCSHEGCTAMGEPCYLPWQIEEPNEFVCPDHQEDAGYCWSCHTFAAGTEGFEFEHPGLCDGCYEAIEDEEDWEDSEEAEYFDPYDDDPYGDWEMEL